MQTYEECDTALRFGPEDLHLVVATAGEFFHAARLLAQDLIRRGDVIAVTEVPPPKWDGVPGEAADLHEDKARLLRSGVFPPRDSKGAKSASSSGVDISDESTTANDGRSESTGGRSHDERKEAPIATVAVEAGGAWAVEKSELLALAKIAVSNNVAVMQITKRLSSAAAKGTPAHHKGPGRNRRGEEHDVKYREVGTALHPMAARLNGLAKVEFRMHSQFPVVSVHFHGL